MNASYIITNSWGARGGGSKASNMFIVAVASEREKQDWLQAFEAVKSAKTAKFVPMRSTRKYVSIDCVLACVVYIF
jgi:hypothetical protein